LVLTQYQTHDTETDGQCNTPDGSSDRPDALLEISYYTDKLQYIIFNNIILGLGKKRNSQDRCLAIPVEKIYALIYLTAALTTFLVHLEQLLLLESGNWQLQDNECRHYSSCLPNKNQIGKC
jgi:hypothetical protein